MKWAVLILNVLLAVPSADAQTFETLYSFTALNNSTNRDGANPSAALVVSGSALYGTAYSGGNAGGGTVFKLDKDGTGFTNLHSFIVATDGSTPWAGMVLSGDTLYGTAADGGTGNGTVFKVGIDGSGFSVLHSFSAFESSAYTNSDGADPIARLVLSGDALYGTTIHGGNSGNGTVFRVNTNGTSFTNLHDFTGPRYTGSSITNNDGANPYGGLVLSGNRLYGTARYGGVFARGAVYAVNADGSAFTTLHSFNGASDGANPTASLLLSENFLYGTTYFGGNAGVGAVFKMNTSGAGFTNLHRFNGSSDGAYPSAGLVLVGGTLYGTTSSGGSWDKGTVFAIKTDGTGFTNLHVFTATSNAPPYGNSDGAAPAAGLTFSGNALYGSAYVGGNSGKGTVFRLSFSLPQLTIIRSETDVLLTWTNTSFGLQAAPVATGTFTNLPGATSPYTNPITGAQQFFRLFSN